MARLRGEAAEVGRWHGVRREDRVCKKCGKEEVADIDHFVIRCKYLVEVRSRMEILMIDRVDGWKRLGGNEKVVIVMIEFVLYFYSMHAHYGVQVPLVLVELFSLVVMLLVL